MSDQRQFLQQHVHHGSLFVLLEGFGLLGHLLCLRTAFGLNRKGLRLALHLQIKSHLRFGTDVIQRQGTDVIQRLGADVRYRG